MSTVDLDEISRTWLVQCGPCDFGVLTGCACPEGDYRPVMLRLVEEIERLRAGSDVVAAALAYVNAPDGTPDGTDEVEQCWWEMKDAVRNYERSTGGDSTDG